MTFAELEVAELSKRLVDWFRAHRPPGTDEVLRRGTDDEWLEFSAETYRLLLRCGLAAPHWPTEFGGMGLDAAQQLAYHEAAITAGFPLPRHNRIGLGQVGATLMRHGGKAQHRQRLAEILAGQIYCIGLSEPDAGSDLAAVRTRAVRDGDEYVINGQKIWSSLSMHADWCMMLTRTDPEAPKHKGMSVLLVDMSSPGVEVRPIRQATGDSEFSEIFLTDVRVPAANLVGAEGAGWQVILTTLSTERAWQMVAKRAEFSNDFHYVLDRAGSTVFEDGTTALDSPSIQHRLIDAACDLAVVDALTRELVREVVQTGGITSSGSVIKVLHSESTQRFSGLAMDIEGMPGLVDEHLPARGNLAHDNWAGNHLRTWGLTISAGTNQIQRNIIAERILGLPRGES